MRIRIRFTTENGSVYVITKHDDGEMTWFQAEETHRSGKHRSRHGRLLAWPEIAFGQSVFLQDDVIQPGCTHHFVQTSRVVKVEEI